MKTISFKNLEEKQAARQFDYKYGTRVSKYWKRKPDSQTGDYQNSYSEYREKETGGKLVIRQCRFYLKYRKKKKRDRKSLLS